MWKLAEEAENILGSSGGREREREEVISGLGGVRKGFMVLVTFQLDQKRRKGILKNAVPGGENSVATGMDKGLDGGEKVGCASCVWGKAQIGRLAEQVETLSGGPRKWGRTEIFHKISVWQGSIVRFTGLDS